MPGFFNGQTFVAPQVASTVDESALAATNVAASATVAVVGSSAGGVPNTATSFTNYSDAKATLRSGATLDVVRRVFDPGAGNPGASKVITVRVQATATPIAQSTKILQDGSAANTVNLTSVDYGAWVNQLRVKVEAGTSRGIKLTIAAPVAGIITNSVLDNIYQGAISLLYTGTGTPATASVTSTALTTVCTGATGDNVNFLFATYPTLQSLVDALNATGKYTAAVLGGPAAATTTLDGVTNVNILVTATLQATRQAFIDAINNNGQFITAAGNAASILIPANTTGFAYLTGGNDGSAPSNSDWTTAIAVLETQDVGIVAAASGDANIHAAVSTHCDAMSGITGKRERIAVLGGVIGETVAQAVTRAGNIASMRVGLAYPGIKDFNPDTGILTTYDPFVTAGVIAGVLAGDKVQDAATYKIISGQGMEKLLKDSEVDTLLTGGVIPVQSVSGKGLRIVQSRSTDTSRAVALHVELSVRRAVDAISQTVRNVVEPLVGTTSGPTFVGIATGAINSALSNLTQAGILVGTPNSATPPFDKVSVKVQGNTASITFIAQVGQPANYVFINVHPIAFSA